MWGLKRLEKAKWFPFLLLVVLKSTWAFDRQHRSKTCGTLFARDNFGGDKFIMEDWDQSVNMNKDYRSSLSGWTNTNTIKVEENCTIKVCDGTYFEGQCRVLSHGTHLAKNYLSNIRSASCDCSKECENCERVSLAKNPGICGRAYLNNTCNKCDPIYLPILDHNFSWNTPNWPKNSVDTVLIREGCTLRIFPGTGTSGTERLLRGPVIKDFKETVGSYDCNCNGESYSPSYSVDTYPSSISLPVSEKSLLELLATNMSLIDHPGVKAALTSLEKGRSANGVYILLLGVYSPAFIGLSSCSKAEGKIGVCRVYLNVNEIGIKNVEVTFIYTPDLDNLNDDARWLATLEHYLSSQPDLKHSIPNAVVVYHEPLGDRNISQANSQFQRKVSAVNTLRGRLFDEHFSNVIFLLTDRKTERNPQAHLEKYEKELSENWNFPKPITLVPRERFSREETPRFNGHYKMKNGEYFFRNFNEKLLLACKKGGDMLGHAVLKAVLPFEETEWRFGYKGFVDLLPANHTKVAMFRKVLESQIYPAVTRPNQALLLQITQIGLFKEQIQEAKRSTEIKLQTHKRDTRLETNNLKEKLQNQIEGVNAQCISLKKGIQNVADDFQKHIKKSNEQYLSLEKEINKTQLELRKEVETLHEQLSVHESNYLRVMKENKVFVDRIRQLELQVEGLSYNVESKLLRQSENLDVKFKTLPLQIKIAVVKDVNNHLRELGFITDTPQDAA